MRTLRIFGTVLAILGAITLSLALVMVGMKLLDEDSVPRSWGSVLFAVGRATVILLAGLYIRGTIRFKGLGRRQSTGSD